MSACPIGPAVQRLLDRFEAIALRRMVGKSCLKMGYTQNLQSFRGSNYATLHVKRVV